MGRPIFDDFRSGMRGEACRLLGIDPTRSHDWASLRETAPMLDPGELSRAANRLAYMNVLPASVLARAAELLAGHRPAGRLEDGT